MFIFALQWLADGEATLRGGVRTECRKLAKSALSDDRREELVRQAHLHDGSSQAEHLSKPPPATARTDFTILKDGSTSVRAILNHGNVP
jgi:hypothetical protein